MDIYHEQDIEPPDPTAAPPRCCTHCQKPLAVAPNGALWCNTEGCSARNHAVFDVRAEAAPPRATTPRDWRTMSIVEIAAENPSASDYVKHWEGRCLKAEAEVDRLRALLAAHPATTPAVTGSNDRANSKRNPK